MCDNSKQTFLKPFRPQISIDNPRTYDVFISHPGTIKHCLASTLYDKLKRAGVETFLDRDELELSDQSDSVMEVEACTSKIVIFGLREEFFTRKWTLQELHWALGSSSRENGAKLIPIFYGITTKQKTEMLSKMAGWMDAAGLNDYNQCAADVEKIFGITGKEYYCVKGCENLPCSACPDRAASRHRNCNGYRSAVERSRLFSCKFRISR